MRAGEAVVSWSCIHHLAIWSIHASEHCHRAPAFQRCTNKIFSFVNFSQSVGLRRFFQRGLSFLNVPPIKPPLSTSPLSSSFPQPKQSQAKDFLDAGEQKGWLHSQLNSTRPVFTVHPIVLFTPGHRLGLSRQAPPLTTLSHSLSRKCIIQRPHTYLDFECGQQ